MLLRDGCYLALLYVDLNCLRLSYDWHTLAGH